MLSLRLGCIGESTDSESSFPTRAHTVQTTLALLRNGCSTQPTYDLSSQVVVSMQDRQNEANNTLVTHWLIGDKQLI